MAYIPYHKEYQTNYRIIRRSDKTVLYTNYNQSCFAEFASKFGNHQVLQYDSNNNIEVIINKSRLFISSELENWYLKQLKKIGIKVSVRDEEITSYANNTVPQKLLLGDCRIYSIRQDDFECKGQVKIALHFIRLCYEYQNYKILENAKQAQDENSKLGFISALYYAYLKNICSKIKYDCGHGCTIFCYMNPVLKLITNKDFKVFFKKLSSMKYDNNECSNFNTIIQKNKVFKKIHLDKVVKKGEINSYQDYLNLFKK